MINMDGLGAYMALVISIYLFATATFTIGCLALICSWLRHTKVRDQPAFDHFLGLAGGLGLNLIAFAVPFTLLELDGRLIDLVAPLWPIITLGAWPLIVFMRRRRATALSAARRAS